MRGSTQRGETEVYEGSPGNVTECRTLAAVEPGNQRTSEFKSKLLSSKAQAEQGPLGQQTQGVAPRLDEFHF